MSEVFRCLAGSRLFGTANADSDFDYKAVSLPTASEVLMGNATFSRQQTTGTDAARNTADDTDVTVFSLQKYVHLLTRMETNAIEMLFAPAMDIGVEFPPYPVKMLRENRFKVLSANKNAFVGFGKSQALRYSVRGERKTSMEALVGILTDLPPNAYMFNERVHERIMLAEIPGVEIVKKPQPGGTEIRFISAFGKEVAVTCKVGEALKVFEKPLKEMGRRTADAAANGGADWKGLYHAQRIVDEGLELFQTGELRFPCAHAYYYREIRSGERNLEGVLDYFEDSLKELEEVVPISEFADQPDMEWATEFVSAFHEQIVIGSYEKWKAAS